MENYCKTSSLICGVAKKGDDHFSDLMGWAGVDKDVTSSMVIYINTENFEKYLLDQKM